MAHEAGNPLAERCRNWARGLALGGARVVIPEVADYEVRRELIRLEATSAIRRLDGLADLIEYLPLSTKAMRLAAQFWATARR